MRRALVVASIVAIPVAVYLISAQRDSELLPTSEITAVQPAALPATNPTDASASIPRAADSLSTPQMSDEERVVLIKHAMSKSMAGNRDQYAQGLVASGLASVDGDQIAQRFIDGVADCIFEATRKEYEAQGVSLTDFLDGAEIAWSQPVEPGVRNLSRIRSDAVGCIATVAQQAGIPLPANLGAANDLVERLSAGLEKPAWAWDMETRIREHIASHPALTLTGKLIACREEGCNVVLVGSDIRIFDLKFEDFAEQNGFKHAVLGGDSSRRYVWLQR
jgi:hypothetical protein